MRYMMFIKHREDFDLSKVPQSLFGAMDKFIAESAKDGVFIDGAGLQPSKAGHKVRLSKGKITTTDGPFTESKEIVAGFWIWEVRSLEEAIEWVKKCPADPGTGMRQLIEVRPIFESDDFGDEFTPELREREEALAARIREQHPDR